MEKWLLIGLGVGGLLLLARSARASDKCMPCYNAKSTAYDKCRQFPPSETKAREACFKAADAALAACLALCS